jgi:hypothetical protein
LQQIYCCRLGKRKIVGYSYRIPYTYCNFMSSLSSRIVDAFQGSIGSAVENAISKKIKEEIVKLDSLLQSIPKQIPIDHVAALNATFVDSPVLSDSFIELEINGLFTATDDFAVPRNYNKGKKSSLFYNCPAKMIGISLHEDVFNTAGLVYLNVSSCIARY